MVNRLHEKPPRKQLHSDRLCAIIEIRGDEILILPLANSDEECRAVLEALSKFCGGKRRAA